MADEQSESREEGACAVETEVRRARYERPVLRHMGSVRCLTLATSQGLFNDGTRAKTHRGTG
jgi:hypothetical protein